MCEPNNNGQTFLSNELSHKCHRLAGCCAEKGLIWCKIPENRHNIHIKIQSYRNPQRKFHLKCLRNKRLKLKNAGEYTLRIVI